MKSGRKVIKEYPASTWRSSLMCNLEKNSHGTDELVKDLTSKNRFDIKSSFTFNEEIENHHFVQLNIDVRIYNTF